MSHHHHAKSDQPSTLERVTSILRNPEADEVYGDGGNDYETEASQKKDIRRSSTQAVFYLGAFVIIAGILYIVFG